jgi:hypothetical protein|tara:strand:+ start:446 stop:1960 length:1515 start_codon:yes stop_codon:yes gene_type:complete
MAVKLFGFTFGSDDDKKPKTVIAPESDDGSLTVSSGYGFGNYGYYLDLDGHTQNKSDVDLIQEYRKMAIMPEVEQAINDIVNEAIVHDDRKMPVEIILDDIGDKYGAKVKKAISAEFSNLCRMLRLKTRAHEIFRRWYIDGRLYYHMLIDEDSPGEGVQELRFIDPIKIKKVKELKKERDQESGVELQTVTDEFYVYNPDGFRTSFSSDEQGIKISPDTIVYCPSGLPDPSGKRMLSYLHKAIKPMNQLRMTEDSIVIYRVSRAPERRIFYIDVGNLPKARAEQYLEDIQKKYRNKLVYDINTGDIRDQSYQQSILEDYWLPRREGGKGTEITTLDGGQNLGELEDVQYFLKKLYKSLNVPPSRLESESQFNLGRSTEITRDELKFTKFIQQLRTRFSEFFYDLLGTQLRLKGIISKEEFEEIREDITFAFLRDSYFSELKEAEVQRERLELLQSIGDYAGKYYSHEFIRRNVLRQDDKMISKMDREIEQEEGNPQYSEGDEGF